MPVQVSQTPPVQEMLWSQSGVQGVRSVNAGGAVPQMNSAVRKVATVADIFLAWPDFIALYEGCPVLLDTVSPRFVSVFFEEGGV